VSLPLEDRAEIDDLLARYAFAIDLREFDELRGVFTDHAVIHYAGTAAHAGIEQIVRTGRRCVTAPWRKDEARRLGIETVYQTLGLIEDEPAAALGVRETAAVEALIRRLRDGGVTVLLISHDMSQVLRVADTAYVLRRGQTAARRVVANTTGDELVGLITGATEGDAQR
jgi:hypothetical protein